MKTEGTIGAATLLAIAAVVGFSLQTGPKQEGGANADRNGMATRSKPALTKTDGDGGPGCSNLKEQLEDFLETEHLTLPEQCSGPKPGSGTGSSPDLTEKTSHLKFVVAMLPDPVHTHLPALFDQFAVAVQEAAQDEKYDFDSSWLPWDQEENPYPLLSDEKTSNLEKALKEDEPGIILFRKTDVSPSESYGEGLVVFVVGEDATHGIHKEQFRSALAWISILRSNADQQKPLAILGPTFSGSLPSLAQVLSEKTITAQLGLDQTRSGQQLAIYSGSVSSKHAAQAFHNTFQPNVTFYSFVQNDDEILGRFCNYMRREQRGFEPERVAIISEDETAYGGSGVETEEAEQPNSYENSCAEKALKLYYPRDISALRGAYQTKSLFDAGTAAQPADTQRRNLPTDLADPAGNVHDSIRSYGGNQTPLTQEAFLLEIVSALRELHVRYILLRSSNTLDQLFLTDFLRRSYPDGRIVIFGSDLMFIRERGATGLGGTMTLSTYPLFPLERDWTEHQALPAADRVFSSDTTEGTYIAFRLLLNDKSLHGGNPDPARCHVVDQVQNKVDDDGSALFLPPVSCSEDPPIPDYSPPFWTLSDQCGERKSANKDNSCVYVGPATWLSVIGVNRFWPMASLAAPADNASQSGPSPADPQAGERRTERETEPGGRPAIPLGMRVFLLFLAGFSLFHACCCWSGSFTAKPAFRAHFASTGDWKHRWLVFIGSCCIASLAVVAGWGCGVFYLPAAGLVYPWFALICTFLVCLLAWLAILANSLTAYKLSQDLPADRCDVPIMTGKAFATWNRRATVLFLSAIALFCLVFVLPIELALYRENRVLTYWRAMHLASGVSPLVPFLVMFVGFYLCFWLSLHGLALFGPDRPRLPPRERLSIKDESGKDRDFLRMFSQEDAAARIEQAAMPPSRDSAAVGLILGVLFLAAAWGLARGVPVRSLGAQSYSVIFVLWLDICCSLTIVESWRLYRLWGELRRLLRFLDRLPLRRTLASLHGFSWGSVWKMSGNVLEVRYKVISRQIECMNHTIAALEEVVDNSSDGTDTRPVQNALVALTDMREAGVEFAEWYSVNYVNPRVGDLTSFKTFQKRVAAASGTLLTQLLVPAWRREKESLLVATAKDEKEEAARYPLAQAKDEYIRNAEEFVCLNYLGFVQNVLGRLRTMAMTVVVLLLAATIATSTYPFDPRQPLSVILIALFLIVGAVIVMVYADMHRDATLSHVTNTKPGELGSEFWFKMLAFGLAPLLGVLTRIFPGITDFVFSWLQPGISSLK